jgi:signal transduction histidine kinase
LVNNSALYSKGRTIEVEISRTKITVKDDGLGMFGIGELVDEIGGRMHIDSNGHGTKVEIALP